MEPELVRNIVLAGFLAWLLWSIAAIITKKRVLLDGAIYGAVGYPLFAVIFTVIFS